MKGFRRLVILGVFLVTLLIVIDIIDAGKKEPKKKELENKTPNIKEKSKNMKYEKLKKQENLKQEKKRSDKTANSEDTKQYSEDPKLESKKYKVKKAAKYSSKEGKTVENNVNPKYTKSHQKAKKYKILEDNEPSQEFTTKGKKQKAYISKTLSPDDNKTLKKSPKDKFQEPVDEELNNVHEEQIDDEVNSLKRKKYKLVEVVLEEDAEEEKEGNETYIELGSEEDIFGTSEGNESEEIVEKLGTGQSFKLTKSKKNRQNSFR
ncbi:stress response protein NST1-like [Homalodisca vitripennis]|uniref:stress response protein NST1-like n=1 Tax=Homalodisca vitripennis TaxID=197043 RepID=UPI001EEB5397|nr:stress response protein NST1-like [Homalodisca vitripennis]